MTSAAVMFCFVLMQNKLMESYDNSDIQFIASIKDLSPDIPNVSRKIQSTEVHLNGVAEDLKGLTTRFYMYDHPNMTLIGALKANRPVIYKSQLQEIENDEQILEALKKSPLRTEYPDKADLFIPPIPLARIYASKRGDFDTPIKTLLAEKYFRKHQGHKHVFVSTCFALFKREHRSRSSLKLLYDDLYNITVIQSWDPSAVYNELHHTPGADWGDYNFMKDEQYSPPLTRRSASIGLGMKNEKLKLTKATKKKFQNSTNFIFYHSRTEPSYYNSTIHRQAPITNITLEKFPKSSIGWGLKKKEWQRQFRDSKFCLVIRGDSPHSHALWRSIRVGCIPVISADVLPIFAPMFKSTLNISDYSIILKEQELVANPAKILLELNDISEEDIDVKIKHLAFAQRVIFTDHPQSLFVPALLKEATLATEVRLLPKDEASFKM